MRDVELSNKAADKVIAKRENRLKKAGLTRTYYLSKLKDLCEAKKPNYSKSEDKLEVIEVPDNQTQLNAIKIVIDLYGDKAPEKQQVEFPDENGNPQKIGPIFSDIERASRFAFLMELADKREKEARKKK